jgi:predicted nucleotidyltransferase
MKTNLKDLSGWTRNDLITFLESIRQHIRSAGFEIGLTGSVLFDGKSDNDGDIIVYPRDGSIFNLNLLYSALEHCGLKLEFSHADLLKIWRKKGSNDIKHVEVWSYEGKRLDIFILR